MTVVVLVVAKAPVAGLAKTRLCPPATAGQAAEIAAASLRDTLDAVHCTPAVHPVLAITGDVFRAVDSRPLRAAMREWTVFEQRGDGFADRLANAHADATSAYPGLPIVQLGMDTPQVTPAHLREAAAWLTETDVDAVLGAAEDGGWWLAGFRDGRHAEVLRRVPMSRSDTGELTLRALHGAGLQVGRLPVLSDVDDMATARAVAAELPGSRFAAAVGRLASTGGTAAAG